MDIIHLTVFGFPVIGLVAIWGVGYTFWTVFKGLREKRAVNKGLEDAARTFRETYRWEPDRRPGTAHGKWVRKDGLHDYD